MSMIRVWAAIEPVPGVVVADVRDVENVNIGQDSTPAGEPFEG